MAPSDPKFSVIIIGAGPAGLATSHCLAAAGIDFTILERRSDVVEESGASLGLWPQGVRLLHQLKLLEAAKEISEPLEFSYHYDQDGIEISKAPIFEMIEERHGYPFMLFERMRFVETLYEQLPDKTKVKTSSCIMAIEQDDIEARVMLADGTYERGDIIIGADGVHSFTRGQIWNDLLEGTSSSGYPDSTQIGNGLKSHYKCLFGCSSRPVSDKSRDMIETHNTGFSFQLLSQSERTFWFLYVKLDEQMTERGKYTTADAEVLAKRYFQQQLTPTLTFQNLWDRRIRFTLSDLEQGIQRQWYNKRVVLVGDSAHKMTPNLAYGFNTALESAAFLTNQLVKALQTSAHPDLPTIKLAFSNYQKQRIPRATTLHNFTNFYTRFAAWENTLFKWTSKLAPKVMPDSVMVDQFGRLVKGGVKLEFLDIPDECHGSVKFDDNV